MSGFNRTPAVTAESSVVVGHEAADDDEGASKPVFVTGVVKWVATKAWPGGWSKGQLEHTDANGKLVVTAMVGKLTGLRVGDEVEVIGSFANDPRYGMQLSVDQATRVLPNKEKAIQAWIEQHLPDIGPARSAELVKLYGKDFFTMLEDSDCIEKLCVVDGITPVRALQILEAYNEKKALFAFFEYLVGVGLSSKEIKKVFAIGIGFMDLQADLFILYYRRVVAVHRFVEILERYKPELLATDAMSVVVLHSMLRDLTDEGSTCVTLEHACQAGAEVFESEPTPEALVRLTERSDGKVVIYNNMLMMGELARDESTIASYIKNRVARCV